MVNATLQIAFHYLTNGCPEYEFCLRCTMQSELFSQVFSSSSECKKNACGSLSEPFLGFIYCNSVYEQSEYSFYFFYWHDTEYKNISFFGVQVLIPSEVCSTHTVNPSHARWLCKYLCVFVNLFTFTVAKYEMSLNVHHSCPGWPISNDYPWHQPFLALTDIMYINNMFANNMLPWQLLSLPTHIIFNGWLNSRGPLSHCVLPQVRQISSFLNGVYFSQPSFLVLEDPSQVGRGVAVITVMDINDNAPMFAIEYETLLCENSAPGQVSLKHLFNTTFFSFFHMHTSSRGTEPHMSSKRGTFYSILFTLVCAASLTAAPLLQGMAHILKMIHFVIFALLFCTSRVGSNISALF